MEKSALVNQPVLIVGAGDMAGEYVKTLYHLGMTAEKMHVVGRGKEKAERFAQQFNVRCQSGGTAALTSISGHERAIVAVSHLELPNVAKVLIERGSRYILIEKPGALYKFQLEELEALAKQKSAHVFVAFNRRFFPSVDAVRNIIEEDGGLLSCHFDFTELENLVLREKESKRLPDEVLRRWGIVNSFHVIDLFLNLAGRPRDWKSFQLGSLPWHPKGATFSGAGITEKNVLFSYLSTWNGAGRWGLELTTSRRKMILRPLEVLNIQKKGSFSLEEVKLQREPEKLKPGFFAQVKAFLDWSNGLGIDPRLSTIGEALPHYVVTEKILGYG